MSALSPDGMLCPSSPPHSKELARGGLALNLTTQTTYLCSPGHGKSFLAQPAACGTPAKRSFVHWMSAGGIADPSLKIEA